MLIQKNICINSLNFIREAVFMQKTLTISRTFIVLAVLVFFGYILNQHIPFMGVHTISYSFDRPNGAIGVFRPSVRYELISGEGNKKMAKILEDPVYFDIKSIVPYHSAHFSFMYKNNSSHHVRLAYKSMQLGKQFKIVPLYEKILGEWTVGSADVELIDAARENSKYTFAFSLPGLVANKSDEHVVVSRIDIRLVRKSLVQILQEYL